MLLILTRIGAIRRGQTDHHGGHEAGESERGKARPDDPPVTAIAVDFGEHITENIGDGKEQHAGTESHRPEKRHRNLRSLAGADQVGTQQHAYESRHHKIVVFVLAAHAFLLFACLNLVASGLFGRIQTAVGAAQQTVRSLTFAQYGNTNTAAQAYAMLSIA